uniref:Uncharacterized protein n=1 Tax=viral metagenome TaxID=1070528 RepID=A0A6H2A4E0_9ZZZZ
MKDNTPEKITQEKVWGFIQLGDEDFDLEGLRARYQIDAESSAFYTAISRLVTERKIKRLGRGKYRRVKYVEPVKWWGTNTNEEPINFRFPRSYDDDTEFGIEDCVEVFEGDMILIAGTSNYGKTTLALNILGENLGLMPSVLMGSEYTASDGKITPKFKRRMNRMKWVNWIEDGQPRFNLYPVGSDYEDYIQPDSINVIDWISLPGEYYLIDNVLKQIKDRVGKGVCVPVIQKNEGLKFGEGGERTERYADIYITVDPYGSDSMITLGKVKAPKGKAMGRMWRFSIVDYGANLHDIYELVKCNKCWGKGYVKSGNNSIRCDGCQGRKFVDKDIDF